jgi:hypothetical protein
MDASTGSAENCKLAALEDDEIARFAGTIPSLKVKLP